MSKQLILKPEKCVSCRSCELVCSFVHNGVFNPRLTAVSVIDYPESAVTIPIMCLQCEEASCQEVCPVRAIHRNEFGAVVINSSRCIVCKMCLNACPLGNIRFSSLTRTVFKCDLCGGDPNCAKFCHAGAITFVDLEEDNDRKRLIADRFKDTFAEVNVS